MDEPSRKRRKTSSPPPVESSPLRKPPRRPSFASPTKASLARNYPNLLSTRTPPRKGFQSRGAQEEAELGSSPPQRGLEDQERAGQGVLFSSPSKRPPRPKGALRRSPLAPAPSDQRNQLARPVEEVIYGKQQKERSKTLPLNPEDQKGRQEKARLEREVEQLKADVSRLTNEIAAEQHREKGERLNPAQRTELIKFVSKVCGADTQNERTPPVSSLLCSFLPFSSITIPPPQQKRSGQPIPSHRPVELSDPLPYLEMFTSFKFSTQIGLPRGKVLPSSKRVHQKHIVDVSGPQKLLTAQLAVTIDCLSNEVIDMHVLRLPPWVERELGAFIRLKAKEKNLGTVCWSINSFWDVATKRASYWHKCEEAFVHLLPGQATTDNKNAQSTNPTSATLSRKDLARHLGRDMLILKDKHVLLKVNWRIVFDWTGEAESTVDVECAVPAVWKEADAGNTFRKIPETFKSLLRTKGVFESTRILVALLFSP